jgi:hypothetical protein
MRITLAVLAMPVMLTASVAQAAARVILLPVVVGSGAEPSGDLMAALAKGLEDNGGRQVIQGAGLKQIAEPPAGLKAADRTRLAAGLDEVGKKVDKKAGTEALAALEPIQTELATAAKDYLFEPSDHDLAYRAAGLQVAALQAAGSADKAKLYAAESAARFPGRKPGAADRIPAAAAELMAAAVPVEGAKLSLKSRPDGCDVLVGGVSVGRSPIELPVLAGATYQAQAVCAEKGPGGAAVKSFPRRITLGDKDTARQEVLDAEFERAFDADGGQRLRFASSPERRQLEEFGVRRAAERYGADAVVLVSVGELSGADWLNGRIYLRSGYLNRQALVRLEPSRAFALGRYLTTGKDTPGVLKPEEAGALVGSSAPGDQGGPGSKMAPWYTDIVGWCFLGAGTLGLTLGLLANGSANRTQDEADAIRGDSERQDALNRDAQKSKFLAGIGMVGGGLMALTGVVLLAIPEYNDNPGEGVALAPVPGGAILGLHGRF